jgi:AraC-like DNA-binding protein
MDPLAALFAHVTPRARTFFAGNLCQAAEFTQVGHLHLFKGGALRLTQPGFADLALHEPTLLFFPRSQPHGFVVDSEIGAELVCATVELGAGEGNPIGEGLPDRVVMPLSLHPTLLPVCDLLLAESFGDGGGRQAALDRLFDYLLILIVRHAVAEGGAESGVLAGLADPRLARALAAMHDEPRKAWTLEGLAAVAGMSRTRFADLFRERVGRTPIDYLTTWRMTLARQLLAKGKPVKIVASQVGYADAAAFSRVFRRVTGRAPRDSTAGRDRPQ